MSNDEFQYQRIFQILKNKIESGLMPKGSVLPSGARLCREYEVSDKTIRRVLSMLTDAGLIETRERRRAIVVFDRAVHSAPSENLKELDPVVTADTLKAVELLCYPLIWRGISMCCEEDWSIPEHLVYQMDPAMPNLFWKNSKLFWRFFIARSENELGLRAVDRLGFWDLEYQEHSLELCIAYRDILMEFVSKSRKAPYTNAALEDMLLRIYYLTPVSSDAFECFVPVHSPLRTGVLGSEQWLKTAEERYSSVYLDILGLISAGVYHPGDQLPSHAALQKQYGVSVTTTLQAIRLLKAWGVVETTRGKGIFVSANREAIDKIRIPEQLIARYTKRYLEAIQLLTLTAENVAFHTAAYVSRGQAQALLLKVKEMEHISRLYQPAPIAILEFLTEHLPYEAMRAVYGIILENYRIGRRIPRLVNSQKADQKLEIHRRCVNAVSALANGDSLEFAKQTAEMFRYTEQQIIAECRRLNYLKAVEENYDGSQLWK